MILPDIEEQVFQELSEIEENVKAAFISFLLISIHCKKKSLNEKEENIEDRHKMLGDSKQINEILKSLKFDETVENIEKDSLIKIYKYMDKLIAQEGYSSVYTLGNLILRFFALGLEKEEFDVDVANKFFKYKNELGLFSIDQTDALLILINGEQKDLINSIIQSYIYVTAIESIYILSYDKTIFNKEDYDSIGNNCVFSEEEFHEKIIYKGSPNKNFNYLHKVIDEMKENSFLLIIGIEKLASINLNKSLITTHVKNSQFNIHTEDSINYNEFTEEMDKIFLSCGIKKCNMTATFVVDDLHNFNVSKELCKSDSENFDIITISSSTNKILDDLFGLLNTCTSREFNEVLDKNKEIIGEENYSLFLALKAFDNEDYLNAEQNFLKLYDKLNPQNKLILANIYIYKKNYPRAFEILEDIYNKDRYLRSLMPAMLETVSNIDNDVQFDEWFKRALDVNDEDCIVIQYAANYYTKKSMYEKSSKEWRKLYGITKNEEYRLLADINLILHKINDYNADEIANVIGNYSQCYPEMKDEANYRIGVILSDYKKKYEKSLEYLKKVDADINVSFAYDAAKLRLRIYKDKILKINISDRAISNNELMLFVNELINDVHILTYTDESNYNWSRYIEDTLPYEKWKEILIKIIMIKIQKWSEIDENLFNETNFNLDPNFGMNIETKTIDDKDVFEPKTAEENLIMLFCNAISSMESGEPQEANDTIFTLFRLASTFHEDFHKNMAVILGLTAWSNSNYKIGDEIESMIALISAMDLGIKCKEIQFQFMVGLNNLFDFLYNNSNSLIIKDDIKKSLYKVFNNPYNELSKNKYYAIIKDYDKVIENKIELFKQIEKVWELGSGVEVIFNVKEEEEEYFADELKILINAYYNKNNIEKACKYIYKYKNSLVINLYKRNDISYKLFYEWATILADNNDYKLSKYFLELAIEGIEKLRSVFHKKERSFVGKEANKIYKKYIEIICRDSINKYKCDTVEVKVDSILKKLLINMVPRSIIEQKQFNSESFLSDEMIEMHEKYDDLFSIINNMMKKGVNDDTYEKKITEFLECKKQLEENHPYFKSLPNYNNLESNISLEIYKDVQNRLNKEELFYQIILIDNYMIHNFISKDEESIVIEKIDYEKYVTMLEFLKEEIIKDDYFLEKKNGLENFIKMSDEISESYIKPLFKYIDRNKYSKLYFMPELNLTYFSMNYMRYKNKWLIDFFDSIENVIDFNVVGKKISNNYSSKYLAHFLNKQDKKISPILKMIKSKNYIDNIDNNPFVQVDESIKTFILIGHGVSDVSGFSYLGARIINKSRKENVSLQEYLRINDWVENTLIISCSSGTLVNDYSERNNGVWSSLFEKKTAYILYCKWDVSIKFTNIILEKVLEIMKNNNKLLSEALIEAQREMSSLNPILWAGLEVWKNE